MIAEVMVAACSSWILTGLTATIATTRGRRACGRRTVHLPPVSVLKPLCGSDPGLEANLRSFFEQSYPDFEVVFGVEGDADPALAVARRLRAEYPHVPCRIVTHTGTSGTNPKVRNLRGMMPFAAHDLVVISDSNVRAPREYLADLVLTMNLGEHPAGVVTNLFAGTGESTLGSALENVQLNGFCAAGAALPTAMGDALVVGKSMLFSRRVLESLGGLERVSHVLAEDYVMGKMFQHAGFEVRMAPMVLENVTRGMTLGDFHARHLRWAMLRWRLRPQAFVLELLTSPLVVLPAALSLWGTWGMLWFVLALMLRDVGGWVVLRGWRRAWVPAVLSPLRELGALAAWLRAPLKRHVVWRGRRARLGAGTLLYSREAAPAR